MHKLSKSNSIFSKLTTKQQQEKTKTRLTKDDISRLNKNKTTMQKQEEPTPTKQ